MTAVTDTSQFLLYLLIYAVQMYSVYNWLSLEAVMSQNIKQAEKFYRPRNPESSPFYQLVERHFDEFEQVYPERYGMRFGFWRPVIRDAIDKFLKCGDLQYGFARVRVQNVASNF